jgi:adenylate kinase
MKEHNLIFLGAPGAGKGTVSKQVLAKYPLAHISTGDLLRAEVAAGTELGKKADALMKSGQLVPDEIVAGMVRSRLTQDDTKPGFILDGFPRTVAQAELLNDALKAIGRELQQVVYFKVDDEILLQRLTARQNCRGCDAIYNKLFKPSKVEGICDCCGSELYQRSDDSLETAQNRLKVYREQTAPLIDFYTAAGLLVTIDSSLPKDEGYAALCAVLQ